MKAFFVLIFVCYFALFRYCIAEDSVDEDSERYNIASTDQPSFFYEPYPQPVGSSVLQLGLSITILPIPVVEEEIPAPAIDLQYRYGLFDNVSLIGSFSTNIFTNLLHGGLQVNENIGNFSVGVANNLGLFGGFISIEGQFDLNTAWAAFYLPTLRLGYRTNYFSSSLSFSAAYIFKSKSKVSELEAPGPENNWNDFFCTFALEQKFLRKSLLAMGLSLTFSKTPYQSWMMFNTIDQYLFVPELFFAVHL